MLVETIARKPITIGAVRLERGDVVSDAVEALLPPGRMKVLKDQGWLAERPVDVESGLAATVAALEARVAALEARRGPGRPRKVEE